MSSRWVEHLRLYNFRNYKEEAFFLDARPVVLYGTNGAGKTNILEALSFFSSGKGFRHTKLSHVQNIDTQKNMWAINMDLHVETSPINLSTIWTAADAEKRQIKINSTPATQTDLDEWLSVLWVTPSMDRLFAEGASVRRKFLDKLASTLDPDHTRRLYRYEHAMRERSRLLREGTRDPLWLKALEETMATESVAIAALRLEFLEWINTSLSRRETTFPKGHFFIEGHVENALQEKAALHVEEEILHLLEKKRREDKEQGGASSGCHLSDFGAIHLGNNKPAFLCSTGEQKALLLTLLLSHTRLIRDLKKITPLLLLDEVVAHLDIARRKELFDDLLEMGIQAWMTGTDFHLFEEFGKNAQYFEISSACVKRQYGPL